MNGNMDRGKGEKQTDRRLENSNILNKYDNKVGGSKVRVACQKIRAAAKKRNYKKKWDAEIGVDATQGFCIPPPLPPPATPCGIVKIVAGCKNFCMCFCVCVCVCGSVSTAVERFLLHYLRYLWASQAIKCPAWNPKKL